MLDGVEVVSHRLAGRGQSLRAGPMQSLARFVIFCVWSRLNVMKLVEDSLHLSATAQGSHTVTHLQSRFQGVLMGLQHSGLMTMTWVPK